MEFFENIERTSGGTPKALLDLPELTLREMDTAATFMEVAKMREQTMVGPAPLSLKELDMYLQYYPVYDTYYFIELMMSIDQEVRRLEHGRVNANSKDRRRTSRESSPKVRAQL